MVRILRIFKPREIKNEFGTICVMDVPWKYICRSPAGFAAGVVRAIEIVERALEKYGPPLRAP